MRFLIKPSFTPFLCTPLFQQVLIICAVHMQDPPIGNRKCHNTYHLSKGNVLQDLKIRCDSPDNTDCQIEQSNCYERFALEQQHLALQTYIPTLYAVTNCNQEALCAASALLSLNAVASTQNRYCLRAPQSGHFSPIDDWLNISALVRGVDAVVQNAGTSIMDGILQPMLRHRRIEPSGDGSGHDVENQVQRSVAPHILTALDDLAPVIDQYSSTENDQKTLHAALGLLRISFAIVEVNPQHESIAMVWSNLLDAHFFPLIKRREPMALILLAYWTVSFGTFQERWWVSRFGITTLRHITDVLMLLDEKNDKSRFEHVQKGDCAVIHNPLECSQEKAADSAAGDAKWRKLLEWPLRQTEVHGL